MIDSYQQYASTYSSLSTPEIEVEIIPSGKDLSSERSASLQRIRTEIMTGSGPDVFVCCTEGIHPIFHLSDSRLFPYVGKAIQEEYFLPLDEYLDTMQWTDWQDLSPEILEGGKNSDGEQVLLPMRFSIPSLVFRSRDLPSQEIQGLHWKDIQDNPVFSEHLRWCWELTSWGNAGRSDDHQTGIPYLFPELADFSSGTMTITQDEMTEFIWENIEPVQTLMQQDTVAENEAVFPDNFWIESSAISSGSFPSETDMTILPMPNLDGGTTAVVYSYCAINSNTNVPESAVSIVDFLMCSSTQQTVLGTPRTICAGMPVNMRALTRKHTGFTEASITEWKKAVERVNHVHFPSPLDTEINAMIGEVELTMKNSYQPSSYQEDFVKGSITKADLTSIVYEHYKELQRLLDEA